MAEKLLGAIAKGTYGAATSPVRSAVRETLDPKIMQTLYRTGIIGPVLRSIASNYKTTDGKKQMDNTAITANVSKNLQSMSFQLSAIADIMDDIRDLTKSQLKLDKDSLKSTEKIIKKGEIKSYEEKLEAKTPISSIMQPTEGGKQAPLVGGALGSILGFAKDNPILTGVLGALLFAAWPDLKEKFKEFVQKSGIDKDLEQLKDNIYTSLKNGISYLANNIVEQIIGKRPFGENNEPGKGPGSQQEQSLSVDPLLGAGIGAMASKIAIGKTLPGAVAGALYGLTDSPEAAIAGGVGTLVGGALLKRKMEQAKLNKAVEKAMQSRGISPAAPAPSVPSAPIVEPQQKSSIILEEKYSKGRGEIETEERRKLKDESKKSFKGLMERIKRIGSKYGYSRLSTWLVKKVGMGLAASLIGGPVGLLIGILSLGFTILQVADWLDDFEEGAAIAEAEESSAEKPVGPTPQVVSDNMESPVKAPGVSSLATPAMTGGVGQQMDYEAYKKRIQQLESGGRNVPSATGGSAFGLYQITRSTFDGLKQKYPEEFKDVSFEDMKKDVNLQNRAFDKLTQDNVDTLKRMGIEPTPFNLYLAHRLGAKAAANILSAKDSNANLIETAYAGRSFQFKSQVYNQNPDMRDTTVGEFVNKRAAAFGTTSPFVQSEAKTEKDPLDLIAELSGLKMLIDTFKQIPPPIVNAPTTVNNNNTTKGGGMRNSALTVSPHSLTKDQIRIFTTPAATVWYGA